MGSSPGFLVQLLENIVGLHADTFDEWFRGSFC